MRVQNIRDVGLALLLAVASIQAQEPTGTRSKQVLGLLDQSRALAPEFCADTPLRIAASPRLPDP